MKEITQQWLDSANDDLKIIEKIIDDVALTHQVAFHAQQSVEKHFKAVVEEKELQFVRTHSLTLLYNKINHYLNLNIDTNLFTLLDDLYIDSRYPGDLGLLPNGKPSIKEATDFYELAIHIRESITNVLA